MAFRYHQGLSVCYSPGGTLAPSYPLSLPAVAPLPPLPSPFLALFSLPFDFPFTGAIGKEVRKGLGWRKDGGGGGIYGRWGLLVPGGVRVTIGRLKIDTRLEVWRTWVRPKVVHP
jgi:hypothetical protein